MNRRSSTPSNLVRLSSEGMLPVDPELLEKIFDHVSGVAFYIKDVKGRYVVVNRSLVERHGLAGKEQMIGRRPCDVCPGDFGVVPTEQDESVLKTGLPIIDRLELHWYLPNRPCWCLTTKFAMRGADGDVTGLIGISQDVRVPMEVEEIPEGVALALRALEADIAARHSASSLAKLSGLSPTRFARLVRRVFGLAPTQWITKTRINAAMIHLRESDSSLTEIAAACGFYDHSAFTRAFRATMGTTPSQYRGAPV